jgi:hypothetical protein
MSYRKIERFLVFLSQTSPRLGMPFLDTCNEIWRNEIEGEDFTEFFVIVHQAIQTAPHLGLSKRSLLNFERTLLEVREAFLVGALTMPGEVIWEEKRYVYPLLAKAIDEAIHPFDFKESYELELREIESEILRIRAFGSNAPELDPAAKAAIKEIAELLTEAIKKIRENGLTHFLIERVFLFGKIELIFRKETTDFGDIQDDVIQTIKRLWAFGNVANTAADMSGKLIGLIS